MKRRWIIFVGFLLLAAILTPAVQRATHTLFLEPLAYYWWGMKQVIRVVPESLYWLFLIASFGFLGFVFWARDILLNRPKDEKPIAQRGPVAYLAGNIVQSERSNYFKWVIANRLAKIALLIMNEDSENGRKNFPGFLEPAQKTESDIQVYLENGLNNSFMDYRKKGKWFTGNTDTPFDVDVYNVIDYLESQMEQSRE